MAVAPIPLGCPNKSGAASDIPNSVVTRDEAGNIVVAGIDFDHLRIISSGGTTTLTRLSPQLIFITGSTTHTINLPRAYLLPAKKEFRFVNLSSGSVTLSAGGSILVMPQFTWATAIVVNQSTDPGDESTNWHAYGFAVPSTAVHTFPATNSTVARTDTGQTFTGQNIFQTSSNNIALLVFATSGAARFACKIPTSADYAQFGFLDEGAQQQGFFGFIGSTFGAPRSGHFEIGSNTGTSIWFRPGDGANEFEFQPSGHLKMNGLVKNYNGIDTTGYGHPSIVDTRSLTAQSAAIGSTNFTNAAVAGFYRVSYYMVCTTAQLSSPPVLTLTLAWTDASSNKTIASATVSCANTNNFTQGTVFVQQASGNLSYSTSNTNSFTTARYALYMSVERLN